MTTTPITKKRDVAALIRFHLIAQDSLTALVEDRIRTAHEVDPDADLSYPLVIVEMDTGSGRYQGGLQQFSVDIYTYSDESQDVADDVYDTLYLNLQAERLWDPSGTITAAGSIREVERPEPGYNEQTRSYFARGTWVVMAAG